MTENATSPGTPALMRAINDRTALAILLDNQPLSRNQLSALSDVSKPTASQMVRRLENAGFIEAVGLVGGTRGPNTAIYGVRADRMLGVAIDVQSDRAVAAVVDAVGTVFPVAEIARGTADAAVATIRAAVAAACGAAAVDAGAVSSVCVGLQASVSPRTDELFLPNELTGWPTTEVRAGLEVELGWAVTLYNDANLAAVAERTAGSGADTDSFALLWLGVGLGFAVDLGGRLLYGSRGAAGEIGNLRVATDIVAGAGDSAQLDDLLDWASVQAIAARAGLAHETFAELAADVAEHPNREAFCAEFAPRVAAAIPPALAVLDPEVIVLGGPLGAAGGDLLASLVTAQLAAITPLKPTIVPAAIRTDPVLEGARRVLATDLRTRLLDDAASLTPR
ncbi:MAG: ROK family transcriptional regulator [Lacisediminihabitans sp.]